MSLALVLKLVHVLSAMVFLGTGMGTAWFKYRADRSGDLIAITWVQAEVVRADWIFTVPAGLTLPLSGLALAHVANWGWRSSWVLGGIALYALAGLCWLPAAWIQIKMRDQARHALATGEPLPPSFATYARIWTWLGVPAFGGAALTVWLMIAKHNALP